MLVDDVFQYRTLIGKSELGCGLDWDEIEQVTAMEHAFAPAADQHHRRRFRRAEVMLDAIVHGDSINDRIRIVEIGAGGLVCRNAPYIARGEQIEIVIDDGDRSLR